LLSRRQGKRLSGVEEKQENPKVAFAFSNRIFRIDMIVESTVSSPR
jgi:hypothetical protein